MNEKLRICALAAVAALTVSCHGGSSPGAPLAGAEVCDPGNGPFSIHVTNPYFPLPVGHQLVLDGVEEEAAEHLVITVLNQVEVVADTATLVVEERETVDGQLTEVSRNFFAQAPDGTVCYFGEDVDIYEAGVLTSHDGAWRAGVDGTLPGIIMPANPQVGDVYAQERAPGVAEDQAEVTARGETVTVPAGTFTDTVTTAESSPLDESTSTKVYARGVGLIKDDALELTSYR